MRATVRAALIITGNELKRIVRHRELLVFGLLLPVIIISLVGLTFGSAGTIEVGVLDDDGSPQSAALVELLDEATAVDVQHYTDAREMRKDVRLTGIQAGLVIPAGYGDDLTAGSATVDVILEPSTEGVATALAAFDTAITQVGVREGAVRFVAKRLGDGGADLERADDLVASSDRDLTPVVVEDLDPDDQREIGSFDYTAPANLVLFVFINTFAVSTVIAIDRKGGQIRRMLATPNPPGSILLGIGLSRLLFALTQSSLIVGVGAVAFGVQWGDPLTAFLLVFVWAILAASVGLLIGAMVSEPDQAQAIGIPIAVGCGMLGGCMWPLEIVPEVVRIAGHATPHAWVMDAWAEIMFDGAGLSAVLPNLAVLAGASVVLGLLAARTLRVRLLG